MGFRKYAEKVLMPDLKEIDKILNICHCFKSILKKTLQLWGYQPIKQSSNQKPKAPIQLDRQARQTFIPYISQMTSPPDLIFDVVVTQIHLLYFFVGWQC